MLQQSVDLLMSLLFYSSRDQLDSNYCKAPVGYWKITGCLLYAFWRVWLKNLGFSLPKNRNFRRLKLLVFALVVVGFGGWCVAGHLIIKADSIREKRCARPLESRFWTMVLPLGDFIFCMVFLGSLAFAINTYRNCPLQPETTCPDKLEEFYQNLDAGLEPDLNEFLTIHSADLEFRRFLPQETSFFLRRHRPRPNENPPKTPCSLCLSPISQTESCHLKCGDWFHEKCLRTWLGNFPFCPVCHDALRPPLMKELVKREIS